MTKVERQQIAKALAAWWASQDIAPVDAAPIMAAMAGAICAKFSKTNELNLKEGLKALSVIMQEGANNYKE
jgi:hypothetical protein